MCGKGRTRHQLGQIGRLNKKVTGLACVFSMECRYRKNYGKDFNGKIDWWRESSEYIDNRVSYGSFFLINLVYFTILYWFCHILT